ncbi:RING finger protein 223 isoform X2 [Nothobranchius furzeri]|uniref:RING finger protein 223 isoform X2 n=1 Tax=Nothobranchius furzeri TaxID=105023 RepID=UPI00390496F0
MTEPPVTNPYSGVNLTPDESSDPVIPTGRTSVSFLHQNSHPSRPFPDVPPPSSTLPLPDFSSASRPHPRLTRVYSTENPYPPPSPSPSPPQEFSISISSSDLQPSPLQSQCSEESCPDLECSICFSQFNNVFRCPKMLHCKHTFCLECLARINVKSAEPSAIQCPLCRGFTPLPTLGLPKLATDADVLSCLPAAMQRVYSIRFVRNKGKLQVKRSADGQRSLASLRSVNRSLDVGLPSPGSDRSRGTSGGFTGVLFRLTGQPACRAFLLTSVVLLMVLLTGVIVFLISQTPMDPR